MRLFCDMDRVLVHQIGLDGFDRMPWMPDGKALWACIAPLRPILLTQVRTGRFGQMATEKLAWIDREIGADVAVIFTPDSRGKGPFARPGDLLIDDSRKHCEAWQANGGTAVRHERAETTIQALRALGVSC